MYKKIIATLLSFILLFGVVAQAQSTKPNNQILLEKDTKVDTNKTKINISTNQLTADGTSEAKLSLNLINGNDKVLVEDLYTVTFNTTNGFLSPLVRSNTGEFTSTFKAPSSGSDVKIDASVKYKVYVCSNTEKLLSTLTEQEQKFYNDAGLSIVNTKYIQGVLSQVDDEVLEIVKTEIDRLAGLDNTIDSTSFSTKFMSLVKQLDCSTKESEFKINGITVYLNNPINQMKPIPVSKTYTPRTGGNQNNLYSSIALAGFLSILTILYQIKIYKKTKL
jgi:hypothetical protein